MKEYFYKKEYKYIYLSSILYDFGTALIEIFGTVMLYRAGISIWFILLIYGLRFGIAGLVSPLFITISAKLGIAKCMLISNIFRAIGAYMMLNGGVLYNNIVIFIIVMGFMGISYPFWDSVPSKYIDKQHIGRYNSFIMICKIIAHALASGLVALEVITNNTIVLFSMVVIAFLLQYLVILKFDYKPEKKTNTFTASIRYLMQIKNKYKIIYALKANQTIEKLFVPLYLYIFLQNLTQFSIVIEISLLFQIIAIILIGKYIDKNIIKSNNLVTTIKIIITGIFLFGKNKTVISANKILSDNFEKAYETSIQTSIQNIIKESKEDNDLLSSVGQMSLCFTKVIMYAILSIISKFIGEKVFIVIFILSILSTIFINVNIKLANDDKNQLIKNYIAY